MSGWIQALALCHWELTIERATLFQILRYSFIEASEATNIDQHFVKGSVHIDHIIIVLYARANRSGIRKAT
jgi:hypothetical protein